MRPRSKFGLVNFLHQLASARYDDLTDELIRRHLFRHATKSRGPPRVGRAADRLTHGDWWLPHEALNQPYCRQHGQAGQAA
jgi:hypothetical protein